MIRAFLAVPLPDAARSTLEAAQAGLPVGRPVAPENLHVTLVFLGEQPEPVLEDLDVALGTLAAPDFEFRLDGVGVFGGERPRLVYAAVEAGPELPHLRKKLARAAREAGIEVPGRKYTPHVTLARFPRDMPPEDLGALHGFLARRTGIRAGPFPAGRFVLYRSTLGRNGPAYDELADYPLVGAE